MSVREGQFTFTETLQLLGAKILGYDDVKVVLGIKDKPLVTWYDIPVFTAIDAYQEDLLKKKAAARVKAISELNAKNAQAAKEYQIIKTRIEEMK